MARINFTNLGFTPSPGAIGHRLALYPVGSTPEPLTVYTGPKAEVGIDGVIDSAEISGVGGANAEGRFDLYLWSYDAAGNESDFAVKANYPLDLVAPAAPVWL